MELALLGLAFVVIDVVSLRRGVDSRDSRDRGGAFTRPSAHRRSG
jgi:hypothetical protein